jgi:hypothetical protein
MTAPNLDERSGRRWFVLIALAALIAVHPLLVHGCSCGHDFDFHLVNWMEAARQFSHGNLHPQWAYSPAFNAGEPRLVFYPPLSWTLGALLGLLLTHLPEVSQTAAWNATPILYTWIALTLAGVILYRLAREFAAPNVALLAATIYVANPYMLFTAFERTAYAELLAAAWMPLLILAILRARPTISGVAIPVALLWLTNAPAAVMGTYTLALLALVRIALTLRSTAETQVLRRREALLLALNSAAGIILGLCVAAFYIVPAAYERRFVQIAMATIAGMRIDRNFLFEHTGTSPDDLLHDQVLHTASSIAVILLIATTIFLGIIFFRPKSASRIRVLAPLAILTVGIAFLLTPLSVSVWNHAPEAAFLQFPWRLLAILAPVMALAIAAAVGRLPLKFTSTAIASVFLVAALTAPAYHVFRQACDPEDTPHAQLSAFESQTGVDPTDEYTPTTADNDALKPNDPPYWLASSPVATASTGESPGAAPTHLAINAPAPEFLILNLRNYPAWRIYLNGTPDPTREQRDDGLIALPVPTGASSIDIRYTRTFDQMIGYFISLVALLILITLLVVPRAKSAALHAMP